MENKIEKILWSADQATKEQRLHDPKFELAWNMRSDRTYEFVRDQRKLSFSELVADLGARSVLDYGCGPGYALNNLAKSRPDLITFYYDPFVPEYCTYPSQSYDLVVLYHVLHHVEKEYFEKTIETLFELCNQHLVIKFFLFKGDTRGRDLDWYLDKLTMFDLISMSVEPDVRNKQAPISKYLYGFDGEYWKQVYLYMKKPGQNQ